MMAFWESRSTTRLTRTWRRPPSPLIREPVVSVSGSRISSTTTASECGSSWRTSSRAASRTSSPIMTARGSSVISSAGYSGGEGGRWETRTSVRTSICSPRSAETGTMSAQSPRASTASSWAARSWRVTASALVTTATTGGRAWVRSRAMKRSPGPTFSSAGMHRAMTSTSERVSRTRSLRRLPSRVLGRWRPGVSTRTSWASSRWTTPRTLWRVVWGRPEVMATFAPTRALVSVDLPALGRPTKQAKPARKPSGASGAALAAGAADLAGSAGAPGPAPCSASPDGRVGASSVMTVLKWCRSGGAAVWPRWCRSGGGGAARPGGAARAQPGGARRRLSRSPRRGLGSPAGS